MIGFTNNVGTGRTSIHGLFIYESLGFGPYRAWEDTASTTFLQVIGIGFLPDKLMTICTACGGWSAQRRYFCCYLLLVVVGLPGTAKIDHDTMTVRMVSSSAMYY
jgi:hypothetical protein